MNVPLTYRRRNGVLRLALACVLLFAGTQDLVHEHGDGIDTRSCYTCHFSVDLGSAPKAAAAGLDPVAGLPLAVVSVAAPRGPRTQAFEARGPPLLS